MSSPNEPDGDLPVDPDEQAFVRALLGEVGRDPEPLPDDVATRLDERLERLIAERASDDPDRSTLPPAVPLERARQRRRRGLTALVAAAAVVVGGYSVTTSGLLTGVGSGSADTAASGGSAATQGEAGGGSGALPQAAAFPMSSRSLRSDARSLVGSDTDELDLLKSAARRLYASQYDASPDDLGDLPQAQQDDASQGAAPTTGSKAGGAPAPTRAPAGRCLDPLVPARFTRLAVTYDGAAATAVLRPAGTSTSGAERVRVEVWDCAVPRRLAVVVVRR